MHFALTNHLSYSVTDQLLALLKIHLPSSAKVPKNSGSLRRRFVDDVPLQQYYCPHCFMKLDGGTNSCRDRECQEKGGGTCYFVPVPITPHLKEIFIGEFTLPYFKWWLWGVPICQACVYCPMQAPWHSMLKVHPAATHKLLIWANYLSSDNFFLHSIMVCTFILHVYCP